MNANKIVYYKEVWLQIGYILYLTDSINNHKKHCPYLFSKYRQWFSNWGPQDVGSEFLAFYKIKKFV